MDEYREDVDIQQDDDIEVNETEGYGKYAELLDATPEKVSGMFKDWFLDYSSYVILHRSVPNILDGLKPVQRRILHAMYRKNTGNLQKVAGFVGEAMHYHPHGDASIGSAIVTLGQKGLLLDCQGNWGNIITGDGAAAARYIEGRLSKFALDVVYNEKITEWMSSYDGQNQEPVSLPVKFPLLLAQGAEGIAVTLRSLILPHNFNELLDASIAILKDKEFTLYPDFPTGGYADCSKYNQGAKGGVVKVRAKIEKIDKNSIAITEVPYSTDVNTLIDSILKVKKKGSIKIRKIENLSTDVANIVLTLPADVSADKTIDALYAFTACQVNIYPNACVIIDDKPRFMTVNEILRYNTYHTKDLFEKEFQIALGEATDAWHYSSLEKFFFENKVYKILEDDSASWEDQLQRVLSKMKEFEPQLKRPITMEDIEKLVEKPVRKISKFDAKVLDTKIKGIEDKIAEIEYNLSHLVEFTIKHFERLKKTYGGAFPRRTVISNIDDIQATKVVSNNAKLYANFENGFVGTNLKKEDEAVYVCDCSDISEIIIFHSDGSYHVTKVSEKAFVGKDIIHVAVFDRGDKRMIYNTIYRDGKSTVYYAKRFAIEGLTRDKIYTLTAGNPDSKVMYFSANPNGEAELVKVKLRAGKNLKKTMIEYDFAALAIKGKASRGNLVTKYAIASITLKKEGISTIGGKMIYFEEDIMKLNEDGRGICIGEYAGDDKVLVIYKDGTYCTCSYDLSTKFSGEIYLICKWDKDKVYSLIYFDGESKSYYIKRFTADLTQNDTSLISAARGSYFAALSEDARPQMQLGFEGGKNGTRAVEVINVEEFIAVKGTTAKGKKVSPYDVTAIEFIEPLPAPESEPLPVDQEEPYEADEEPAPEPNDTNDDLSVNEDGGFSLF